MIMHRLKNIPTRVIIGSQELYLEVRGGFVASGTSLNRWCIANKVNRQTAERALRGQSTTRSAIRLVERIVSDALPAANDAA
jgi:hypothetical protein